EPFVGEVSARASNLVGNDAEQLAAEGQQHLASLAIGIFLGNKQDAARQACQSFKRRASTNDLISADNFRLAGEFRRQPFAAIHHASLNTLSSRTILVPR